MKLRTSLLIFSLICSLFLAGCGKDENLPAQITEIMNSGGKGWLRLGVYGDPLSLNPVAHIESEHGQMACHFVHASPIKKLDNGEFSPYLFDSYSIFEGSSGTIILEAVWKKGLKWHDGVDFDPRDLEFTFEQIRNSENQSPYSELLQGVESISSFGQGQRTRIVFNHDSIRLLDLLTIGLIPSHIIKEQKLADARVEVQGIGSESWPLYADQPVGLGPFRIEAREKGSFLQLVPNQYFFDNASRSSVLIKSYYDYQQLVSDFRGNKLDWINLPSMLAEQLETMKLEKVFFIEYPNPACMAWVFNTRNSILADVRVRQALDLLADRKKIQSDVPFAGQAIYEFPGASGPVTLEDYTQNFAKALNLLDAAGWKDTDSDGIRDRSGQKLELRITFNDDNLLRRALAEKFSEDCKRAGINLILHPVSWADLISSHLKKADFDTALISYKIPTSGNVKDLFHSQAIAGKAENSTGLFNRFNFSGIADGELDRLLDELDSMLNKENRQQKFEQAATTINGLYPAAFLFRPSDVGLYHAESGKVKANSAIFNDVLNWKVLFGPEDSQL